MRVVFLLVVMGCSRSDSFDPGETTRGSAGPPAATVTIDAPPATAGVATTATVTVTAPDGFHINAKYPAKLALEAAPGVDMPRRALTRDDAQIEEKTLRMPVALTAQAGEHAIHGHLSYAYCREDKCVPRSSDVTIVVAAK